MTVEDRVNIINGEYINKAKEVFPFISKIRITILKEGYYRKQNSNYRGLSIVYDKVYNKQKAIMLGYYFVDKNYIIIPEGLKISSKKQELINSYVNKGFEVLEGKFPSLKPIEFKEDSKEYQLAMERKKNFIKKKNDIPNHG